MRCACLRCNGKSHDGKVIDSVQNIGFFLHYHNSYKVLEPQYSVFNFLESFHIRLW